MRTKQFSIVYSVVGLDSFFRSKRVIYIYVYYVQTSNFEFDA